MRGRRCGHTAEFIISGKIIVAPLPDNLYRNGRLDRHPVDKPELIRGHHKVKFWRLADGSKNRRARSAKSPLITERFGRRLENLMEGVKLRRNAALRIPVSKGSGWGVWVFF